MKQKRVDRAGERDDGGEGLGPCSPGPRLFAGRTGKQVVRDILSAVRQELAATRKRLGEAEAALVLLIAADSASTGIQPETPHASDPERGLWPCRICGRSEDTRTVRFVEPTLCVDCFREGAAREEGAG